MLPLGVPCQLLKKAAENRMKHGFLQLFHLFDLALLFDSSFSGSAKRPAAAAPQLLSGSSEPQALAADLLRNDRINH